MSTIYEITDELMRFLEFASEAELTAEQIKDTLDAMEGEFDVKLDGYGKYIKSLEKKVAARKEEIERLRALNEIDANEIERKKAELLKYMDMTGKKKGGVLFKFTAKDSAPKYRIINEFEVPEEYYKIVPATKKLDKTALNKAAKADPERFKGIVEIYRGRQLMMK